MFHLQYFYIFLLAFHLIIVDISKSFMVPGHSDAVMAACFLCRGDLGESASKKTHVSTAGWDMRGCLDENSQFKIYMGISVLLLSSLYSDDFMLDSVIILAS